MSGLIQRLGIVCSRWALELRELVGGRAHHQGLRLLMENLSPSHRQQLETLNYFDVVGGSTGAVYRIHIGDQMNITQLDTNGKRIRRLCFGPEGDLPVGDTMLAQKIALELFELEVIRAANQLPPWQTPIPPIIVRQ